MLLIQRHSGRNLGGGEEEEEGRGGSDSVSSFVCTSFDCLMVALFNWRGSSIPPNLPLTLVSLTPLGVAGWLDPRDGYAFPQSRGGCPSLEMGGGATSSTEAHSGHRRQQ